MKYSLSGHLRGSLEKSNMPALLGVLYGKGIDSVAIELDASEFIRTYRKAGSSAIVQFSLGKEEHDVIIKQIDLHPTKNEVRHVDLYAIKKGEKVTIKVPLVFQGEAPAVKDHGGIFLSNHDTLQVRCLPKDIPHEIIVDISELKELHAHVTLADLSLDTKKFEALHMEQAEVICTVAEKQKAKEEEVEEAEQTETAEEKK